MKVTKVNKQETDFTKNYTDTSGTKFTVTSVESIDGGEIVKINPGYNSYFYKHKHTKTKIILHNTVGVLRSDIASLSKPDWHVSVPYVIARNGTIYELFDPTMWSYHLGRGAVGGNKTNSKSSIAIELSSYGPLKRVNDNLETMYSNVSYTNSKGIKKTTGNDVYCSIQEREHFIELPIPYRGYSYFAGYTDAQLKSLNVLVDYLCNRFDIPKQILDETIRYNIFSSSKESQEYSGICSHVNFISNGKWDIGPEMDWSYLFPEEETNEETSEVEDEETEEKLTKLEESTKDVETPAPAPAPTPTPVNKFAIIEFVFNLFKKIIR